MSQQAVRPRRERPQLRADDVEDTTRLHRALNEVLLGFAQRLEALESAQGLVVVPDIDLYARGTGVGDVRADFTLPFAPTGLVVLQLRRVDTNAVITAANDVKWQATTGPLGACAVRILHVSGLPAAGRYLLRVGVTRG